MNPEKSNIDQLYVRRGEILESQGQDETVILDRPSGIYFSLNEAGQLLWQQIRQPRSLNELAQILVDEFDLPTGRATQDAGDFLNMLVEANLVVRA